VRSLKIYLNKIHDTYPSDFHGEPFQCLWLNVTPSQVTTSGHSENAREKCASYIYFFFAFLLFYRFRRTSLAIFCCTFRTAYSVSRPTNPRAQKVIDFSLALNWTELQKKIKKENQRTRTQELKTQKGSFLRRRSLCSALEKWKRKESSSRNQYAATESQKLKQPQEEAILQSLWSQIRIPNPLSGQSRKKKEI